MGEETCKRPVNDDAVEVQLACGRVLVGERAWWELGPRGRCDIDSPDGML